MKPIFGYTPLLRAELDDFLRAKQAECSPGSWDEDFLKRLRDLAGGGKLLRGSLVCFSYRAWSGRRPNKAVIRAALAVELAHAALLIHDDIMDGDELRRGQPSMHRQYHTVGAQRRLTNSAGFGINMALCGGDITLVLAFELLAGVGNATVSHLFSDQLLQTCGGQMEDVSLASTDKPPTKRAIYAVMERKTAGYTLALPLAMGAALAGEARQDIDRLRSIGTMAGIIFQIRDDELGVLGDRKQTGKPVGADIRENKKTLLRYYLMKRCSRSQHRRLSAVFGNPAATSADIRYVQSLLQEYRIPHLLSQEVERLRRQAGEQIDHLALRDHSKQDFRALLDFCSIRQF